MSHRQVETAMPLRKRQAAAGLRARACGFRAGAFFGFGSGSKLRVTALATSPARPTP
jgi:hypothetical protein